MIDLLLVIITLVVIYAGLSLLVGSRVRDQSKGIGSPDQEVIEISETHIALGRQNHYEQEEQAEHYMELNKHHG